MSDYDDDELPPISVNIFDSQSMQLNMPDADVLALQRAEEALRDIEIRRLRKQAAGQLESGEVALSRTDSSGSEGEASLAATLDQLAVIPSSPIESALPPLDALLEVFSEHVPGDKEFCKELLLCLKEAGRNDAGRVIDCLLQNVTLLLNCEEDTWTDEEFVNVCVSLLSVCACGEGGERRGVGGARRAAALLRQLLDNVASETQLEQLSSVIVSCLPSLELSTSLRLSGALRGAARGGGERVAGSVTGAALRNLLGCDWKECTSSPVTVETLIPLVTSSWRTLDAKTQYQAILLLGRTLRTIERIGDAEEKDTNSASGRERDKDEKVTETNSEKKRVIEKNDDASVCGEGGADNKSVKSTEVSENDKDISTNNTVEDTSMADKYEIHDADEKEKGDLTILTENLKEVLGQIENDRYMAIDDQVITLDDTIIETQKASDTVVSQKGQVTVTELLTENKKENVIDIDNNTSASVLDKDGNVKTANRDVKETNDIHENKLSSEDDVIEVKVDSEVIEIADDEDVVMLERDEYNSRSGDGIVLSNKTKGHNSSESELLATLKHLTANSAKHHPDRMKVVVGVDKLQLLLGNGW